MVKYALFIGADLRGLSDLQPSGGCDDPHFTYLLKVRCESCGEERDKDIGLRLGEMTRLKSHLLHAADFLSAHLERRRAHVLLKCKLCGNDGHIKMLPGYGEPLTLEKSEKGEKAALMIFECNGVAPITFSFADGWSVTSADGSVAKISLSKETVAHNEDGMVCGLVLNPTCSIKELKESLPCPTWRRRSQPL